MEVVEHPMYDISDFVDRVNESVAAHKLAAPGEYRRWSKAWKGRSPETAPNPYGCADAANILYTIGSFPRDPHERKSWVTALQALQSAGTGMFNEATHHPIHTTAHCIAALELFDAGPLYPISGLWDLRNVQRMESWLETLDWWNNPWTASHKGAGLYVSLVLTGAVSLEWQERYFSWLWINSDPETGFLRRGYVKTAAHEQTLSIFPHLAGTFHYFFNHVYARRPFRYPAAVVDTCLRIYNQNEYPLGQRVGFAEIDWVFCLARSLQQSGHRFAECRAALTSFAERYIPYLCGPEAQQEEEFDDLHKLFGAMCCLAELQQAVPGLIKTERPLRLVLDRRPFI
jgi:hypothetical protein